MNPTQCPVCGAETILYQDEGGKMRYQAHLSRLEQTDRRCYMSNLLEWT